MNNSLLYSLNSSSLVKDVVYNLNLAGRDGLAFFHNENSKELLYVFTDGDIRRMLSKTPEIAAIKASDIMGTKPKKIAFDAMAIDALNTMEANNISQILVVNDKKKYVGVIHIHDLIKEGIF